MENGTGGKLNKWKMERMKNGTSGKWNKWEMEQVINVAGKNCQ